MVVIFDRLFYTKFSNLKLIHFLGFNKAFIIFMSCYLQIFKIISFNYNYFLI